MPFSFLLFLGVVNRITPLWLCASDNHNAGAPGFTAHFCQEPQGPSNWHQSQSRHVSRLFQGLNSDYTVQPLSQEKWDFNHIFNSFITFYHQFHAMASMRPAYAPWCPPAVPLTPSPVTHPHGHGISPRPWAVLPAVAFSCAQRHPRLGQKAVGFDVQEASAEEQEEYEQEKAGHGKTGGSQSSDNMESWWKLRVLARE